MDSAPLAPESASRPGPLVALCPAWRRPRPGSPGVVGMAQGALPHGTLGLPGSASWGEVTVLGQQLGGGSAPTAGRPVPQPTPAKAA